ncbi:MAG TPA: DUF4838 domain-containing protein [Candidatus Hydrogenedentes bacterium]|nr:DUF4838 domain-containing protein [Candidatus Hydrogenedentota bacterium]HOS02544.1 DUF4838 domain-containing protein [Candidatus Hydrogenedentota bacterium]
MHPASASILLTSVALVALPAWAAPWITSKMYGNVHVVVSETAPSFDAQAAKEFAAHWKACTGHSVSISDRPADGVNVFIGRDVIPARHAKKMNVAALQADGLHLRSVKAKKDALPALLIAGGTERGALYGVYEFFERYMGMRWLAPGVTFIPDKPGAVCDPAKPWERATPSELPAIDYRYVPPFEHRRTTPPQGNAESVQIYRDARRLSEGPGFGSPGVHTLYSLVDPKDHFEKHPEWFSMIDGKRLAPVGYDYNSEKEREKHPGTVAQLCFTNPEVANAIVDTLRDRIRKNPDKHIWSVSQMDWGEYCTCPECKAINESEGTPMGSLLTCVNRVADQINQEFPGYYIETLAYSWSRKAPKTIRPHDNVIIRLCSIECDFARPLNDPKVLENAAFAQDIREWSAIAKKLYIWDYVVNFYGYQRPHPNLPVLAENVRFFRDHKARGLYEQGPSAPLVELGHLRTYLLTHLIWNPDCDVDAAREDFLDLYYRETAPFMRQYLALIEKNVIEKEWMMDTFDKGGWIDYDTVVQAREILHQGREAAQSDETRQRIEFAQVSVEYAAFACTPRITLADNAITLDRPPCMSPHDYIALAKSFGIREYAEKRPIEEFGSLVSHCPPRQEQSPIETIENERYRVWVTPAIGGTVMRWQDKPSGVELINAFREYGMRPCTWQDWTNTPFKVEGPVADRYDVVERAPGKLVIEAKREDGLVVRRTMSLQPGSDVIEVTLTITNPTDKALIPNVKPHPEFYAQGSYIPEIWSYRDGTWTQYTDPALSPPLANGKYLKPEDYSKLACRVKEKDVTVICEFNPAQLGGLLWFYNASSAARQMNLELLPKTDPLAPGASMTIAASYRFTRESPATLR